VSDTRIETDSLVEQLLHGTPLAAWRRLVESARLFEQLAPWGWISPSQFIGLRFAADTPIAFVSIMGAQLPTHCCFAYLGWEALATIQEQMQAQQLSIRDLIETPALQVNFPEASTLDPKDLAILAACPLPLDKSTRAPLFRSHRPGFLPWILDTDEVHLMTEILRQTAGVAMRSETDPALLEPPEPGLVLVRSHNAAGAWVEEWLPCPARAEFDRPPVLDVAKLAQVAALRCGPARVQFDLSLTRATVGEKGSRIRTTYLLAAFDSEDGRCIGADVILPTDGIPAMWRSVPDRLLAICLHAGTRPREIEVCSEQMMETLRPLLGKLPIRLTFRRNLPHFQAFIDNMDPAARATEMQPHE
jgi:hypothetical protein